MKIILSRLFLVTSIVCFFQFETQGQAIIRGPYLQKGTPNSMVIRWRTDAPTNSRVWYGNSPTSLTKTVMKNNTTNEHEVLITHLTVATTYYYAVGNDTGQLAGADNKHYFRTSPIPDSSPTIRTWVLGDAGRADDNQRAVRDGYYTYIGSNHTDMILQLGDNAYPDGTDSDYQVAWFENMYEDILINTVLWPCPGNHDLGDVADSPTQTGPYYDIFTMPKEGEAGGIASGTEAWYSFDYGNVHIISLDSDDTSLEAADPRSPMLTWLEEDLSTNTKDWTFVILHHPVYKGGTNMDEGSREQNLRENFAPVWEAGGVDLVMYGHNHVYERSYLLNGHYGFSNTWDPETMALDLGDGKTDVDGAYQKLVGGMATGLGTVYVTSGNAGSLGNEDPPYHPAMAYHYPGNKSSSYIEVSGLTLNFKQLDEFGNVVDYFTINKTQVTGIPPNINITAPFDDQYYPELETITLEAQASDPGGQVTQVAFFVNDVLVGTDNVPENQTIYKVNWTIPANGTYRIHALVTDNDNNVITSPKKNIQVGPYSLCCQLVGKRNDAEQRINGVVNFTNTDLEIVNDNSNGDQIVGLRFENLGIPQGALILSANIQFTVGGTDNVNPANLVLRGENSDAPLIFQGDTNNISDRPLTNASVTWSPPNWSDIGTSGPDQLTPDISSVIQEIVNRPGFGPSSPIAILVDGDGRRTASSYDENPAVAAVLCISYTPGCVGEDNDNDGKCTNVDCDDNNPLVNAVDCDGVCGGTAVDLDGDGYCSTSDCNDLNPLIYPGATEICDGIDNNCDGKIDEVIKMEICDGIDNDCDGLIDEGLCLSGTIQIPITSGDDDAEERNSSGFVNTNNPDLELGLDSTRVQTVGLRFSNLTLPQRAVIKAAFIQFTADESHSGDASVDIKGENVDSAAPFISTSFNISDRPTTSAVVKWNNIPPWSRGKAGPAQRTHDLSTIVQEIVNRRGWNPGNAMAFIISGTGIRTAESFDGKPTAAAVLHIEYDKPTFEIVLYPNPFQDELWFTVQKNNSEPKEMVVTVIDINGIEVYRESGQAFNEKVLLPLSESLAPGIYFLSIQVGEYLKTMKLAKH